MLAALCVLPVLALCFSQSDIELFQLRKIITEDLGESTTFYSWLGVKNNAKNADIVKAYRKLSRKIHPDRNPGQEATERFARLNRVYKILRSPLREQYDSYLRSGFPKYNEATEEWTYRRFRPGLILAVFLLAVLFTAVEFVARKVNASRKRQRIDDIIADAQFVAKKNSRTPGVIMQSTDVSVGPNILTVHPSGDVYFQSEKLTSTGIEEPTWQDTLLGQLVAKVQAIAQGSNTAEDSNAAYSSTSQDLNSSPQATEKVSEVETLKEESGSKKSETEILKKGAAKRRPAAARGKAKVF